MSDREPVCFTCGQPTSPATLANRLEDGTLCPACQDRLLDSQPPLLPRFHAEEEPDASFELPISVEFDDDPDDPIGA